MHCLNLFHICILLCNMYIFRISNKYYFKITILKLFPLRKCECLRGPHFFAIQLIMNVFKIKLRADKYVSVCGSIVLFYTTKQHFHSGWHDDASPRYILINVRCNGL